MSNHKYTFKFSKSDHRDFIYENKNDLAITKRLPSSVDLRKTLGAIPIFDQGQLGSCAENSGVRLKMSLMLINKLSISMLSRLYLYVRVRMLENTVAEDAGSEPRDVFKVLANNGVCQETLYPYDISQFKNFPTSVQDNDAVNYKINSYYSMNTIDGIKHCIASGLPVLFGATVYQELETVGSDGFLKLPTSKSQVLGGHAITIVGYKNATLISKLKSKSNGYFIVANSWGADWGDKGYFYIPYEYLTVAQWEAWSAK